MTRRAVLRRPAARLAAALALTLAGVGAGAVSLVTSASAAGGACPEGTGVTVVVDFGPLGGGVQAGCDPDGAGKQASAVVPAAGFSLTYVNGQAFVCRIDGLPDASQEGCQRTPPADAYWGLFWSDGTSGTWVYSTQGVSTLKVEEGGSIGWRFQDGGDRESPGMAPPAADEPSESPSPTSKPTPKPSSGAPAPTAPTGSTPGPGATSSGSAAPTPEATAGSGGKGRDRGRPDDGRTREKDRDRAEPTEQPSPSATVDLAAEPTAAEPGGSSEDGSGLTLLAAGAVAVLGAAAVALTRRRRT